jgi:hypothetical protein
MKKYFCLILLLLSFIGMYVLSSCTSCTTDTGPGTYPAPGPPWDSSIDIYTPSSVGEHCTADYIESEFANTALGIRTLLRIQVMYVDLNGTLVDYNAPFVFDDMHAPYIIQVPSTGFYALDIDFFFIYSPNDLCYTCDCCAAKCSAAPFNGYGTLAYHQLKEIAQYETMTQITFAEDEKSCDCCEI